MLIPTTTPKWPARLADTTVTFPQQGRDKCGKTNYELEPIFAKRFEAIHFATYEYNKRLIHFVLRLKNTETDETVSPTVQAIFNDINELSKEEDYDGYLFKPMPRARRSARRFVAEVYKQMGNRLARPRIVPDGKGGIIMEWRNGADVVKLGCVAADTKRDYIYYKRENIYDAVEASVDDLIKWLHWLNHE